MDEKDTSELLTIAWMNGAARGREAERAAIVAWLRGIGFGDEDQNRAKFEIIHAIEAGEHLK